MEQSHEGSRLTTLAQLTERLLFNKSLRIVLDMTILQYLSYLSYPPSPPHLALVLESLLVSLNESSSHHFQNLEGSGVVAHRHLHHLNNTHKDSSVVVYEHRIAQH